MKNTARNETFAAHLPNGARYKRRNFRITSDVVHMLRCMAKSRKVRLSCVIREAVARYYGSIDVGSLPRIRRPGMVHVRIRLGPRMSENIRARLAPRGNASAFVDACCVRYLRDHQLEVSSP